MDPDRAVEIGLGGAALQRDTQALGDLAGIRAHHVRTQHPVSIGIHDQLHQATLIATAEGVLHGAEFGAVDHHLVARFPRLGLGQADRADVGLAEDRCGDIAVVHLALAVAKQPTGQDHGLGERNRCQLRSANDIPQRADGGHRSQEALVHVDMAGGSEFHAQGFQAQPVREGAATGRRQYQAGFHGAVVRQPHRIAICGFFHGIDGGIEPQADTLLFQLGHQKATDIIVKAPQEELAPVYQRGLDAQARQDAGKLHGDIAATPDDRLAGQLG